MSDEKADRKAQALARLSEMKKLVAGGMKPAEAAAKVLGKDKPGAGKKAPEKKPAKADKKEAPAKKEEKKVERKPQEELPSDPWEANTMLVTRVAEDKKAKAWPYPARYRTPEAKEDLQKLVDRFGAQVVTVGDMAGKPVAYIKPEAWLDVATFAKEELGFDHLAFVSGADYPDETILEVHAQLYSYERRADLVLKAHLWRDDTRIASLTPLYTGADWHEREGWDLLGIRFEGHPDLRRRFLPDGWRGHPLLKDYDESEQYIGLGDDGEDVVFDTPGPDRW